MKRILSILVALCLFTTSQAQIGRFPFAKAIASSGASGLTEGLISYYSFEEESGDLIDLHGSHDGTVSGSVYGGTGKIGNCYTFTATAGQGVTLPTSTDFNLAGTKGSISVWFVTSVGSYSRGWIAGTHSTYATQGYGMYIDSEAPSHFKTSVGSSDAEIAYTVDMAASASWHHAVMTWDVDGNLITYLDGTQVDSREITISPTDRLPFTIGVNEDTSNPIVFSGSIDELAIYNRVLTSDEVTELNNSGNGKGYANF